MSKRVLSVGQCSVDHAAMVRLIQGGFGAEVVGADLPADALARLKKETFDLVLVNRNLDADYSDGLEIIKEIKQDPDLKTLPVMLVTNYPDQQQLAVEAGAEPGFGKLEYEKPATRQKLSKYLA